MWISAEVFRAQLRDQLNKGYRDGLQDAAFAIFEKHHKEPIEKQATCDCLRTAIQLRTMANREE
jgi:hypothetical protein